MCKIEQGMLDALSNRVPFRSANTKVVQTQNQALVYLHDNHIATITYGSDFATTGEPANVFVTNAGWTTRVTIARLHAIVSHFWPARAFVRIHRGSMLALTLGGPHNNVTLRNGRAARITEDETGMHCTAVDF